MATARPRPVGSEATKASTVSKTAPRGWFLGAIAALAVVAAACGGGSKAASQPTTTVAGGRGAALQAFRRCMASHGVTLPQRQRTSTTTNGSEPPQSDNGGGDNGGSGFGGGGFGGGGFGGGGFGGGGGFANRFNQAPPGVDPAKYQAAVGACRALIPNPQNNAQFQSAFTAYVNCLKSHGVQAGDPSQGFQALSGVDRNSATFQAAQQVCRPLLPNRGPGSTTSTTD